MLHDPLANALNNLKIYERTGKNDCVVSPGSRLIRETLKVMQNSGYLGAVERKSEKENKFAVRLIGKINNCGVIKPRFPVKTSEIEQWERQYLPAKNFGILIISTPYGVMTHNEAKAKNTGGVLLAYVY